MKGTRLVIGLDYGTTYTGNDIKDEHIEIVHGWPSQHTKIATKEKVPSEVAYQPTELWGAMIPSDVPRHLWTKLESENRPIGEAARVQQEASALALTVYKSRVDIISDFLNHAVEKAGFNPSHFPKLENIIDATEPESAAIHTIAKLRNTAHDAQFERNDGFILCDVGGGTVDLISYKIAKLDPTVVEEVTVGSGGRCGGTFVDRAFLQRLERRLGTKDFIKIAGCRSEQIPRAMLSRKAARMLQNFTMEIKGGFFGCESYTSQLPSPLSSILDDSERGIEDGEIKIKAENLVSMFDMPVRRTYELLSKQLKEARKSKKATMKRVFLVGGFSESAYMYRKIKDWADDNDLQAFRPTYAWSAVARGAVAKGLESESRIVAKRKNRRHYGTSVQKRFVQGVHQTKDVFICNYTGEKLARNQMNWLLKMGQDLPTSGTAHVKIPMGTMFWPDETRESTLRLEAYNRTRAPKRSHDPGVFRVATATVDLSLVPKEEFKTMFSPEGCVFYDLSFDLELSTVFHGDVSLDQWQEIR